MHCLRLFWRVLRTVFLQTESVPNFLLDLGSGHFAMFLALRQCAISCEVTFTPFTLTSAICSAMRSKRAPLRSGLGHFHHDHHLFGRVTLLQFLRDVLRDFHCLFLSRDRNLDGLFGGALKKALFRQELPSRMHQPSRCAPSFVDLFCFGVCRVMLRGRYTPNEHRCSAARAAQHHICRKTRPHTRTSSTAGAIC